MEQRVRGLTDISFTRSRRVLMLRIVLLIAALLVSARLFVDDAAAAAATDSASQVPVRAMQAKGFGSVLATRGHRALYYWTPEKAAPGKILCVGECAKVWPVLTVPRGTAVPRKVAGYKGTFGTIRRPDGRLQLTYNRLPLYTYAHEGPRQVLCNDVDGWFVIRL
jgi:predicted lipoprotein with Yx(FWY)xxD motif